MAASKLNLSPSLKAVFDRPVAFHRCFVEVTGGVLPALMLSQAYYWSNRTSDPDGWFWKTQEQWETETGLGRTEVMTARRQLRATSFWQEELRGAPPKMYFRIDQEKLLAALQGEFEPLSLEQCLANFETTFKKISKTGYMRARKAKAEAEHVDYAAVLAQYGMVCYLCGNQITKGPGVHSENLTFDHVIPLSRGGSHLFQNIRPAHVKCNVLKGNEVPNPPIPEAVNSLTAREFNSLTTRELNSLAQRKSNGLSQSDLINLPQRKNSIYTTETIPKIIERESASPQPSLISVLIEVYAETITSQADDVVLQKQAVTLEGKGITVETLRTFFAETELRPARFVAQNLLVWQAARTRQREKQLAESLVGASPEERQRRLALVRGHVSASIAAQPEPEPDVALTDAGRTLWDDVLDVLERSISPEAFATWFRPTRFFAQEGDCLKVQIPDAVFDDWIWNNYAAELEAAMSEAGLSDCVVEFVVAERKAA